MEKKEIQICNEQEWRWCLVGNIVEIREFGQEHEIRHGTKHFSSGTKVFINLIYGGMGHERIQVIGIPRYQRNYIEIVIPRECVENMRIQKVFKPAVLKRMKNSDWVWWGKTDNDRNNIIKALEWLNPKEAEKAKRKYIE